MDQEKALAKLREIGRSFISDLEFNNRLHEIKDFEYKSFDKTIIPHLYLYNYLQEGQTEREMMMVALNPEDMEHRREMLYSLGGTMRQQGLQPVAAFLVVEAWLSQQSEVLPSKAPDRREAIVISGCTMDYRYSMVHIPLKRYGDIVELGCPITSPFEGENTVQMMLLDLFFKGYLECKGEQ
jgi:hypothetical protein